MSFCPHFRKSDGQYFLKFLNPWGKVLERSGLRIKKNEGCKIAAQKQVFFFSANVGLINPLSLPQSSQKFMVSVVPSVLVEICFVSLMQDFCCESYAHT